MDERTAGEERENERKAVVRRRSSAMVSRGDGQVVRKMEGERKARATRGNGERRRGEERSSMEDRDENGREIGMYGREGDEDTGEEEIRRRSPVIELTVKFSLHLF